jgi:hypothetical protein
MELINDGAIPEFEPSQPVTPPMEPGVEATQTPDPVVVPEIVKGKGGKNSRKILTAIIIAIVLVGAFIALRPLGGGSDPAIIQGKVALSAQGLRDVVIAKRLTVYWAGPQAGAKYTLVATSPGVAYVRYLPGGVGLNDTNSGFRAIGTYTFKNAFDAAIASGKEQGNAGFVNADGNAVLYSQARSTNVYVGIKGKDIQVEVYDPVANQALGLVLVKNQISQIK